MDRGFGSARLVAVKLVGVSLVVVKRGRLLPVALLLGWAGAFAAPMEPAVPVIRPTAARITRYLDTTGTVAAMQSVDLVARIAGTLEGIEVADGAIVTKGTTLFVIEPPPYESKLRQAQAAEEQQRAVVAQADAEHARQAQLRTTSASSQSTVDSALATRDSARAALQQAQEATRQAAITYAYTRVTAPFDGVMTARLVSAGEFVGSGSPTKLATIMQLDPIWVNANISEADVRRARAVMAARGKTVRDLGAVPVEAALPGESGYPHQGTLDYVAPLVDAATGTLALRGRFGNAGYALLPGALVKLRIALGAETEVLLLPDDAIASDQGTPTVFVVGADGGVTQRPVRLGGTHGGMRIVEDGVTAQDRVAASAMAALDSGGGAGGRVRAVEAGGPPVPVKR